MAPKFIIDINLPDVEPENQNAACLQFLEEKLEDFSTTPLSVALAEDQEGSNPAPVLVKQEENDPVPMPKPAAASPPSGTGITALFAIISRDKAGNEGICTIKGQPLVCGLPGTHEKHKKAFKAQLMVDPAPADLKFRCVKFTTKQELGAIK